MAKSRETFNKRSREIQRQKQKQEKKEKMQERRSQPKGKQLEDMIAYIDEDGNITNTAPDPRLKKVFKAEDIQIATPPGNERDSSHTGMINFFNEEKGFGFIVDAKFQQRIFFHSSQLQEPVKMHDKVKFDTENSDRGLVAIAVKKAS